eukprot:TRINITY_DN12579_c0_g1_i2.p1 TRINITY_DN12579_c0_g1~~TRINITY_DN12579_c0_g1_i2.p1  ORF type:complete len:186 (+),score=16.77 TRINITY_DN12579_c0_g1_i2:152-709(+)
MELWEPLYLKSQRDMVDTLIELLQPNYISPTQEERGGGGSSLLMRAILLDLPGVFKRDTADTKRVPIVLLAPSPVSIELPSILEDNHIVPLHLHEDHIIHVVPSRHVHVLPLWVHEEEERGEVAPDLGARQEQGEPSAPPVQAVVLLLWLWLTVALVVEGVGDRGYEEGPKARGKTHKELNTHWI